MGKRKILVILTGGTICSFPDGLRGNKNQTNVHAAKRVIIDGFEKSASPYARSVEFDERYLVPDTLSENMTVDTWNRLLDVFRKEKLNGNPSYAGVIVLHGTDTLAYTASLLSIALAGAKIPVVMVSSQLNLNNPKTNGHANFRAAVELIMNGILPNVYAVYQNEINSEGELCEMLLHYGSHLLQCESYSNNFHSKDEVILQKSTSARYPGKNFGSNEFYLDKFDTLAPSVLMISPYVGLKYSRISLDGVDAVIHTAYHSQTVCTERKAPVDESGKEAAFSDYSVLHLIRACKERGIPLFLTPCDSISHSYVTTSDAISSGALHVFGATAELVYVKSLVGAALGKRGCELEKFLKTEINREFVYKS